MGSQEEKMNSLQRFWQKTQPAREKTGKVFSKIGKILRGIGRWIYRLRGLIMAIPVALAALWIAGQNMTRLPGNVGLMLLENGEYYMTVSRAAAVMSPLALTGVCLVLMFCSRRVVYPWLISIFTLIVPYAIYFTNVFPA